MLALDGLVRCASTSIIHTKTWLRFTGFFQAHQPASKVSRWAASMQKLGDVVFTQDWLARSIVEHFNPQGTILEPCKGGGAFTRYLPTADWCEISEGRDFFDWSMPVDWMIGNPPYSKAKFLPWIIHSFKYAENIVYLLPIKKVYNSFKLLQLIDEYGGIKEHFVVGPGHRIGFRYGFAFGAVHFQRGYKGGSVTTFTHNASTRQGVGVAKNGQCEP